MDTYWLRKKKKGLKTIGGKALRVTGSFILLAALFGPLAGPQTPLYEGVSKAFADNLEWTDYRPPMTDSDDTDGSDGFALLPQFGDVLHAIAVAPNGDILTAGLDGEEVTIFKSTDGGYAWSETEHNIPEGAVVRDFAPSPDPSDDFWILVFSGSGSAAATNGVAISTNGGDEFTVKFDGRADENLTGVLWHTVALSNNFDYGDGSGRMAIGGEWEGPGAVSTVFRATTDAFKANPIASTTWSAMLTAEEAMTEVTGDKTLNLSYSTGDESSFLARLWVHGGSTYGQTSNSDSWDNVNGGEIGEELLATMGEVAFDEIYDAGDWFYAAVGDGFGRGGVYKYDGGWSNETQGDTGCRNRDFSSLFVSGNGSSADLVAAANEDDDNRICTSTNATDTWSDRDADGGDDQIDSNRILAGPTRLGGHIDDPQTVFWTSGGGRGGVAISNSGGSGWHDSGLPNEIGDVSGSLDWATDQRVFVPAGESIFYTSNMGEGSSYRRVFRGGNEEGHEARLSLASGFTTHGVAYILRSGKDEAQLLKSTDGAMTFFEIGDDTALDEEKLSVISIRSATTLYVGGDEGSVAFTDDGGASWTLLSTNFGDGKIDEFDFVTATHFYVTAERNNTMEVNETTDGGGSFTQIGETPWGSGTGGFGVDRDFIDKATGEGILIVVAENQSVRGFYKYDNRDPDAKWDKSGIDDVNWTSKGDTGASGIGDGRLWWFWNKGASELWRTYFPISIDSEADWEDLKLATDIGPAGEEISGSISVGRGPSGSYVMYSYRGDDNRLRVYTLTAAFQSRPVITSPLDLSNVPTNVGDEGIPTVFRWTSVPSAACYELQISLEEDFDAPALDPTGGAACPLIDGVSNGSTLQMDKDIFSLVIGQTYFWRARVRSTDASEKNGMRNEGPWSAVQHFTVSTTSPTVIAPEPSLPLNGSQLPGLSTQLSWNNPPGVTQVHIQVSPLNDDGPGINLIMNATSVYSVPAPIFGEGPYVMLPGATYTWRVQITNAVTAIGENDPSWGPWSEPRTFTTAPPISGTIGLLSPIGGAASSDTTPTLEWKDSNPNDFYFEVQLSHDKNFGEAGAVAPVFHNLIHGGQSDPPNSYTVPDAFALSSGTYFWRVRQRVQATPSGASETGIAWTPAQTFVVQ